MDINVSFAIPTVVHYIEKTIPVVVDSLLSNNVQREQIHVFINSSDKNVNEVIDGITYHHHMGLSYFEWLSPKLIMERNLQSTWWFLLHDTVKFGPRFEVQFDEFMKTNDKRIVKLTPVHSNSIGMLHQEIFNEHKQFFLDKFTDLEKFDDLIERKRWCIQSENSYLRLEDFSYFQKEEEIYTPHRMSPYEVLRVEEYFHGVDMTKYKKNNRGYAEVRDVDL